jgi:mono/diheme cytochrome c family protein
MNQVVKWTVVWVSLLLLLGLAQALAQPAVGPAPQDPLAGSQVFGRKGCSKCHAVNGVGGQIGADLARLPRARTFYDFAAAMWNHIPRMADQMQQLDIPRPHLSPQETGNLIAFLYTLNYFDPGGNAEAGRQLFVAKKCAVCHQVGNVGGVVGPPLDALEQSGSPIFVAAAMWNHGFAMTEKMRAKGIERPTFKGSELLDLIAYLKSAAPAPAEGPIYVLPGRVEAGRLLFSEKHCIECHSVKGQGGQVEPDLARRELQVGLTQFAAAMWNKIPAMMEAMQARQIPIPTLQAQEMADLIAYLQSVQYFAQQGQAQKGRQLVRDKGCLQCHAVSGTVGKEAPAFAQVQGLDSPTRVVSALWNHAFGMERLLASRQISWPQLRPEDMADLVAFLQSLGENK